MKKIIFIITAMVSAFAGIAQTYKVESMENLVTDLSARTNARVGNDGNKCALIKVYVNDDIVAAHGSVVGNIKTEGLGKYIYLAHGTKEVELVFKNHMPLHIKFDDYLIPSVTGLMTYKIILTENVNQPTPTASVADTTNLEKEIKDAYDEGCYNKCYELCQRHADHPVAQFYLGRLYNNKAWESYDPVKSTEWYRKAAEQGYAKAQNNLGFSYEQGRGVEKNLEEALKWYHKAAEQGLGAAQNNIGMCYKNGRGVTKDLTEAVKWLRKAAENDNSSGLFNLGWCYYNGEGVEENYDEAKKWWRKAAKQGHQNAIKYLKEKFNE